MNREMFTIHKVRLVKLANDHLASKALTENEKNAVLELLKILDRYSFENRLEIRGLISRTIIDSLELDDSLGADFIQFDSNLIS